MSYQVTTPSNAGEFQLLEAYSSDSYKARNGTGSFYPATRIPYVWALRQINPTKYQIVQCFIEYTIPGYAAGQIPVSAFVQMYSSNTSGSTEWDCEARLHDWGGGAVNYTKWVTPAEFNSSTRVWRARRMMFRNESYTVGGGFYLRDAFGQAQTLRCVLSGSYFVHGHWPALNDGNRTYGVYHAQFSPNTRPQVREAEAVHGSATATTQFYVSGASTQLSDGTCAFLSVESGTVQLRHTSDSGATSALITTLSTRTNFQGSDPAVDVWFNVINGQQSLDLVRDKNDNLYVIGASTYRPLDGYHNSIAVQAFTKNPGYSWTAKAIRQGYAPEFYQKDKADGDINNVSTTYHDLGTGYLVTALAHTHGSGCDNQLTFLVINCDRLITESSGAIVTTGAWLGRNLLVNSGAAGTDAQYPANDTGTGLDHITRAADGIGVIATYMSSSRRALERAPARTTTLLKYQINTNGQFSVTPTPVSMNGTPAPLSPMRDCDAKIRLLSLPAGRYALVTAGGIAVFGADHSLLYTATNGTAGPAPLLGHPPDAGAGVDARTLHFTPNWDALYDPSSNRIVIYHTDCSTTPNPRTIVASSWSVSASTTAPLVTRTVATLVGPSGSRNHAFRIPRQRVRNSRVMIHLGNVAADNSLTTQRVLDTGLNSPPVATVDSLSAFPASMAKVVQWTYTDADGDNQASYQLQVLNSAGTTVIHDTGTVAQVRSPGGTGTHTLPANTLSNNTSYTLRVRATDSVGALGAWSAPVAFTTVSGPVVTITDPPADYPDSASSSLMVTWDFTSTTGTTQASYQVRVLNTVTSAVLSDTGFIAGPSVRTHTVTGLLSNVDQTIQVYARDSASTPVVSSPGVRRIKPSFSTPPQPTITLLTEYGADTPIVALQLTNPDPVGENPPVVSNTIYRRTAAMLTQPAGTWEAIGTALAGSTYNDYTAASGVEYEYYAVGISAGGTSSAVSVPTDIVMVGFLGTWIHDPGLVAGLRWFPYAAGKSTRKVDPLGTALRLAGRTYPIVEYGEQRDDVATFRVLIPHGDDDLTGSNASVELAYLHEWARNPGIRMVRDGRGRAIWGVLLGGLSFDDQDEGTSVTLEITRVDYVLSGQ